jgi:hypothetical protein
MQINPVHALLALLRQQAQAQLLEKPLLRPREIFAELAAESNETQFRLALLEKRVADQALFRNLDGSSPEHSEATRMAHKFAAILLTSGSATDAIIQKQSHSHGRAWHHSAHLWQDGATDSFRYQVVDTRAGVFENLPIAQKFTPTSADIAEALFREGEEPEQFARMVIEKSRLVDTDEAQAVWPRLLVLSFGVIVVAWLFKCIF